FHRRARRSRRAQRFRREPMPCDVGDYVGRYPRIDQYVTPLIGAPESQVEKESAVPARLASFGQNPKRIGASPQDFLQLAVELGVPKGVPVCNRELVQGPALDPRTSLGGHPTLLTTPAAEPACGPS